MAHDLDRFVSAQESVHARAIAELRRGRKDGHWMWFVFPQLVGLGRSPMAQAYGIADLAEARAYLAHPVLGPRLIAATGAAVAAVGGADAIFGPIDAMKLRSSMTLFAAAADDAAPFVAALARFFDAIPDPATLTRLAAR